MAELLNFASDYIDGAHPNILRRMLDTNTIHHPGYGTDALCAQARDKIRAACEAPDAQVYFAMGGTQTNMLVISVLLRTHEGVVAADSAHINWHEAGAIEASGHKVLTLAAPEGKLQATDIDTYVATFYTDANHQHEVFPGMVYLSQTTEYGTLYTLAELEAIAEVCHKWDLRLFVDGARLAYALAADKNDVLLPDLARLCDAFYIGGTKCGALFGEAIVFKNASAPKYFFTHMKQRGAVLAKGWLLGLQFDELFTNNLYLECGKVALEHAARIRAALNAAGVEYYMPNPTNQILVVFTQAQYDKLSEQVMMGFMEHTTDGRVVARFATSWSTTNVDVDKLCALIGTLGR